jgi:hypothetical protein
MGAVHQRSAPRRSRLMAALGILAMMCRDQAMVIRSCFGDKYARMYIVSC